MQWNNVRANFSDSNQLMGIAANQVNQGVTTATDTLTNTAELFRQAEQDKLAELERRHRMLIADKTLELENEKFAETERLNDSTIDLNNADIKKAAMESKLTGVKIDKTNAEIANDKNKTIAEVKRDNALARLYSTQADKTNVNAAIAKKKQEEYEKLLKEQEKDRILNRELKIQKQQYNELKTNGSQAFTVEKNDKGELVIHKIPGKVWHDGEIMSKDRYDTLVNVNNAKKITKTNEAVYKTINSYLDTDPKKFDKAVGDNNKFLNKGLGDGSNYYINSKTYKNVIGTLTSKFKGNIQEIKRMVDNGLVYDPTTGGVGIPKEYVNTKGNFVSTIHRNAFLIDSYIRANGSSLKDPTKYRYIREGFRILGIKDKSKRKKIFDILDKRPGG